MSTEIIRPQRSMSYNDIKKRRMLRQKSKSRCKLKSSQASTQIIHTQKKVYPSSQDIYASERPNQVDKIKQVDQRKFIKAKGNQIKNTVKRSITNNFSIPYNQNKQEQNLEAGSRIKMNNPIDLKLCIKTASNEDKDIQKHPCSQSREIIRELIEQSKSQRRLILYKNMRNKYKLSKSRSQSKSAKSLVEKSRILAKRLIEIDGTPEKPVDNVLKGIKNSHRIKRFQSVNQNGNNNKASFRYLINVPRDNSSNKQLFKGNKSKGANFKIEDQNESSIEVQKQSDVFDSSEDKFLQQICLKPQKSHEVYTRKQIERNSQNILDLLDIQQKEVSKAISKRQREKKILKDLEKLNKKFPKGFFKF